MKAEEKAKDLMDKFELFLLDKSQLLGGDGDFHDAAKECALMATEEVIVELEGIYTRESQGLLDSVWYNVKAELQKL